MQSKMKSGVLISVLLNLLCVVRSNIIDLSHPQQASTIYWPRVPTFNRSIVQKGTNEKGVWIEVGAFSSGEHGGTHIDAPRHFFRDSYDLKDLPLEYTVAEGVMIDAKAEAAADSDYVLTQEKLEEWEKIHGRIPDRSAVLINFGWTPRFTSPRRFFNTNTEDDPKTFHFPVVSEQAAQWLLENRNIKMLGLDVPAPDSPRDGTFPVHVILLSKNRIILENVMIPDTLPARDFRVHAAPIRIEGGTGVQTRIYAMTYDANEASSTSSGGLCYMVLLALIAVFLGRVHQFIN